MQIVFLRSVAEVIYFNTESAVKICCVSSVVIDHCFANIGEQVNGTNIQDLSYSLQVQVIYI